MEEYQTTVLNKQKLDVLHRLAYCTTCIDDLWTPLVDKETFQIIAKGIYPQHLQLGLGVRGQLS